MDEAERTKVDDRGGEGVVAQGPLRLVVVGGPEVGRRYLIEGGATLGRSSRCTIVIADPYVSREHARIERGLDGTAYLVDTSRRQATRVNGSPHSRGPLWFGDKIEIGKTALLVAPPDATEEISLEQDRIQALGYLSAGVAHDFNNMLGVIQSTLTYLRELDPGTPLGDESVAECLEDVETAARRSAQLVGRILSFARKDKEAYELLDFGEIVTDVLHLAARGLPKNIQLTRDIGRELWVRGARAQLAQLTMNLCLNARDAMPSGGVLNVSAGIAGGDVRLVVEDTGIGMDAATRARIFERYFTTKEQSGNGLGLTTVVEVTRWHGGSVSVESEPGKGARFQVRLPYADPRPVREVRSTATPAPQARVSHGRILIADGDAMVRRSVARLLRQWGYEAVEVGDPARVVATYAAERPDLVLFELDLPAADGRDVWAELRGIDAAASVAFVTGRSAGDWEGRLVRQGALGLLQKPLDALKLRTFVETALRSSRR